MKKRASKVVFAISILFSVFLIIFVYRHPIILKWMAGSAKVIGWPMRASVYADGKIDQKIRVFHSDKYWNNNQADYYILYILSPYSYRTKHILSLDIRNKHAGVPSVTDKNSFDLVFGLLFQSEAGTQFSDFRDETNGYGFDPHMDISGKTIRFNLPSKLKQGVSLIRIEFSE
ncbi:MAG TPA: hypothetical protein VFI33_00295 [Puia sp.]|nr:hypothetical protein [Puia sp.]